MTTTHSIAPLPDLATFVRDQLADYLDGLGHVIEAQDERDGFPCLSVEHANGSSYVDLAVVWDAEGARFMDMTDGWRQVTLRGFDWQAEARDTGVVYGPASLTERTERLRMGYRLEGPTTTPASATCPRCSDPVQGGASMHPTCRTLG